MTSGPELLLALAAGATALLAAVALGRGPRGRLRWSFGLGMLGFAVEAAAELVLVAWTKAPEDRLLWIQASHAAGLLLLVPWAFFVLALVTPWTRPLPRWLRNVALAGGAAAFGLASLALSPGAFDVSDLPGSFYAVRLGSPARLGLLLELVGTVAILAGLEAALRGSRGEARWRTKYLVLGLGGVFLVRFYFLSQVALFNVLLASHLASAAATLLLGAGVVAVSLGRDRLGVNLSVSRQVVYRSVVVGVLGAYLVAVGVLGWLLQQLGMSEDLVWTSMLVFVSAVGLAAVMLSEAVRWRIKRFIATNFYRTKYDYREQWTNFTARLGSLVGVDELGREVTRAVAETIGATAALLLLRDPADGRYRVAAVVGLDRRPDTVLDAGSPLLAGDLAAPGVLAAGCPAGVLDLRAVTLFGPGSVRVPLLWRSDLVGLVLLGPERTGDGYGIEDVEFLATVAQQAAGALVTAQLSETLARTREFEAFHRLTSFVIHDLKNSISALSLLSDNALKNFDDPEFQRDAIRTLARTVERMTALMGRLSRAPDAASLRRQPVDVASLVLEAALPLVKSDRIVVVKELAPLPPVAVDADAMLRVVQNLVTNAVQAIGDKGLITLKTFERDGRAVIAVTDTGCGMSDEFMRTSLFSPFRSTKKGGWGIGLYQVKGIVEAHGGTVEVASTEGAGTTFRVVLPLGGDTRS